MCRTRKNKKDQSNVQVNNVIVDLGDMEEGMGAVPASNKDIERRQDT